MKLLMLGDTHGNYDWIHYVCKNAVTLEVEKIVQLGDFGFGFGKKPDEFLDNVEASLRRRDLEMYWIDGNHDNHTLLREVYCNDSHKTSEGFYKIREHLFYIPRGLSWVWAGQRFLGLGGAYSVDKDPDPNYMWPNGKRGWPGREQGVNWWPEERITRDETELAKKAGKVDILLSHDAPWDVDIPGNFKDDLLTEFNRKLLTEVVRATFPEYIFHGHYHKRYQTSLDFPHGDDKGFMAWHRTIVTGLHRDNNPGKAWLVVELKEPQA